MNVKFLAVLFATMLPSVAFGQSPQAYQCTYGDLQRRVEIYYEAGVTVPCEVHYYKDTEAPGEQQVLWRALNETGYCERKTEELLARLRDSAYQGFLALEPHLVTAGKRGGFSGTEGMRRAVSALRGLMADAGCVEVKTSPS